MNHSFFLGFRVCCTTALFLLGVSSAIRTVSADSFDWRSVNGQNWNSTVKSQFGGTCWDFSACGTLEAKYKLTRNDSNYNPDVSEQQICWETNPDMGSTNGGWGSSVLNYFTSHGVVSETECPYQSSSPDIGIAPYWPLAQGWENRVWKSVSNQNGLPNDINTMKQYLKTQGPLEVGVQASNDLYDSVADLKANYRTPVSWLDHEVVLVGFYDDASAPTGGYWVIKNSWDTGYGDKGYGYVPYGNIEVHSDIHAITGAVYYTGAMAAATWNGGTNTWSNNGNNWTNDKDGSSYAWENKETVATFSASTGTAVTISGSVIAHGLKINAGSTGYSFSGGSLTVTAGGIMTGEDVVFNSPVFVGGPQSWNVAAGKNLYLNGPLHTVISDLTFSGAGNTTISGAIDGGGVANLYGGSKPGGLIQAGSGTLTLTGISKFGGDVTVNSGAGALCITPLGGGSTEYSGAFFGGGSIIINSPGTVSIGGGSSNFTGSISLQGGGTLAFIPASGLGGVFSGVISGDGSVAHNGAGTTILTGANAYSGSTTINSGALEADFGKGIPSSSLLILNGGVYQNDTGTSFSLSLGTSGNAFQWAAGGGGFAAGSKALTVNIGNNSTPNTLVWSSASADIGSAIVGPLKFGSTTATKAVVFLNPIDLNGADRTIQVDDNTASTGDYAELPGSISGSAGIVKAGTGLLKLSGSNSFTGVTTIAGGQLQAAFGVGVPASSFISLDGGVFQFIDDASFTRPLGSSGQAFQWATNGGGFSAGSNPLTVNVFNDGRTLTWGSTVGSQLVGRLMLNAVTAGNSLTFVNGIDLNGGTRTLSVDANSVYLTGSLNDSAGGGSLIKTGNGSLTLSGDKGNTYTGRTTIQGGNLNLAKNTGYAIAGDLYLGGSTSYSVQVQGDKQIAPSSKIVWNGTSGKQDINLNQHDLTVAGLSDNVGRGSIESYWTSSNHYSPIVTVNNPSSCTYAGSMSGSFSLVKTGMGTLTLAGGDIYYSGSTTISQGKLVMKDVTGYSLMYSNITNNSALEFNYSSSNSTFGGTISGKGSITKTGGNKLYIEGSTGNTYTGLTSVLNGTLVLAKSSGYAIPGNLTISDGGSFVIVQNPNQFPATTVVTLSGGWDPHFEIYGNTLTVGGIVSAGDGGAIENTEGETGVSDGTLIVNNKTDCTYGGAIRNSWGGSGKLSLVKDGVGTLTLNNSRSGDYTGGLTVKNGTLDYSNGALPACNYTISGGTLNIGGNSQNITGFQITGGTVGGTVAGSGTLTSSTAYDIQGGTVNAILAGSDVALNKTGSGTAILANNNTFTGLTTISAGTLQLGVGGFEGSVGGNIFIDAGGTLLINRIWPFVLSGKLSGTGTLIKSGTGALTMSGANTFSGSIIVNAGMLDFSSATAPLPVGNYTLTGGTLGIGSRSQTIGKLSVSGGTISGSTGMLTSNATYDIQGGTISARLGGSNIGLNKTGASTAILNGSNAYTGSTTISAGVLQANSGVGLPSPSYLVLDGGMLQSCGSTAVQFTRLLSSVPASNAFQWTANGGGFSAGAGALNIQIGGNTNAVDWSDTIGANLAGTLKLNSTSAAGVVDFQNGLNLNGGNRTINVDDNASSVLDYAKISGPIADGFASGGIVKTGAGTLLLTGELTYTGTTTISQGILSISSPKATLTTITGSGTLSVVNGANLTASSITVATLSIGNAPSSTPVPEPSTWMLLVAAALAGFGFHQRRK